MGQPPASANCIGAGTNHLLRFEIVDSHHQKETATCLQLHVHHEQCVPDPQQEIDFCAQPHVTSNQEVKKSKKLEEKMERLLGGWEPLACGIGTPGALIVRQAT